MRRVSEHIQSAVMLQWFMVLIVDGLLLMMMMMMMMKFQSVCLMFFHPRDPTIRGPDKNTVCSHWNLL